MSQDFESRFVALAERTMRIQAHCAREDAARIYLVMPFLELLGYDAGDPSVIVPEHEGAIDFAVMIGDEPAIAIEAAGTSRHPNQAYARLHDYCESKRSVRIGIATNGVVFEAFTDSQQPNVLDDEPFMRIDLAKVASGETDGEAIRFLKMLRAREFDPAAIVEQAFEIGVRDRFKACLLAEFRNPSEAFCRLLLEQIGIPGTRSGAIDQHFRPILKSAMEQALIVPVIQAIRHLPPPMPEQIVAPIQQPTSPMQHAGARSMEERLQQELAAFGKRRRSA